MRVVFNRCSTIGARTGIGHYSAELLTALTAQAAKDEIGVYPTGWMWKLQVGFAERYWSAFKQSAQSEKRGPWAAGLAAVGGILTSSVVRQALRKLQVLMFRHFQSVCRKERYDLYHEPNSLPMPCDCPTIATLHDLSPITHPEWHPADRVKQYHRHLERALSQCTHLLTGSDCTRHEIISEFGVAPQRVTRVYHGIRTGLCPLRASEVTAGLRALGLPPSYLLHVGTLEPRKNLCMLLRAFLELPATLRQRCPLVLVGKWGWNSSELAEYLDCNVRRQGVIHLGYVAEQELGLLYNGAQTLVYPSFYEGFGLPPLEMMACGGAVLGSSAGAVAEVMGPCGQLIDPRDSDGWRDAMRRAIVDDDWLRSLRHGTQAWAAPFTWKRCANQTLRVYGEVLGSSVTRTLAA